MKTHEYIRPSTQERIIVETILTDIQNHDFDLDCEYFIPEWDDIVSIESEYGGTVKTQCGRKIYITDCSFYRIISKREPTDEEYNSSLASYYSIWQFLGYSDVDKQKIVAYHWMKERKEKGEPLGYYRREVNHIGLRGKVNIYPLSFLESLVERNILKK